ncbi:MAG TPA: hypothetical protein VJ761_03845 [Ktedonobacteraceae bacterium]|nr:hypothetical protein [Ktedonobacteraceae bacterium]
MNEQHIWEKHHISRTEVEEVCYGSPANMLVEVAHDGRYRLIGPRLDGRILVVILSDKGEGKYYPVTAKQTKRQELRRYTNWKESNEQ